MSTVIEKLTILHQTILGFLAREQFEEARELITKNLDADVQTLKIILVVTKQHREQEILRDVLQLVKQKFDAACIELQ